ncbi:MAG: metalloregulator ArsR/SmtB family transcription factor [Phycisphaeraceae bacterium]
MIGLSQDYMIQQVAGRFQALADENRLRLLILLQAGEQNVSRLTEAVGLRQASVSKHLAVLRQAGLVTSRRDGTQMLYRVADASVYQMCQVVCDGVRKRLREHSQAAGLDSAPEPTRRRTPRSSRSHK